MSQAPWEMETTTLSSALEKKGYKWKGTEETRTYLEFSTLPDHQ
jgi:hypothetical protein